jgi:5-formyltetrahydrofolate cyclo-ligase
VETSEVYDATELQDAVWFVPGLGFDNRGNRLGRGGGYYDRFLHRQSGFFVAVAYDWQLLDSIPYEAHDAKIDALVTDKDQLIFIEKDF